MPSFLCAILGTAAAEGGSPLGYIKVLGNPRVAMFACFTLRVMQSPDASMAAFALFWVPSSFLDRIKHVVALGAEKEMVGINTGRVVTTMTDQHPVWYRSVGQHVGKPVGVPTHAPSITLGVKAPMSLRLS